MEYNEIFEQDSLTREQLAKAVSSLSDKKHFLLNVPMRTGKSFLAIELIKKWNVNKILILSGANSTNNQWIENITKYNSDLLEKIDVYCYQSLHKIPRDLYDVICLDEADLITEKRLEQLSEFEPEHWIAMSGTLEEVDKDNFRSLTKSKYFEVEITLEQAINWGILPQPKIFAVRLSLDNTKRYLIYHKGKDKKKKNNIVPYNERWSAFKDKSKNALIQCTEHEYHLLITEEFERWKSYEEEFNLPIEERSETITFLQEKGFNQSTCRDKKMRIGNERKKFFADIKNRHFKKLFSQLPQGSRCLVFCNDTKQADLLNEEFAVHSNKPGSLELVEQFNNKEIPYLFSVGQLARGIDTYDVDYVIIIQSSMKQGNQVQKFGRSLLSTAPKIIIMYYPQTQDEKYVKEFLKQFKEEWVIHKQL